jgi:hypothetical protein
MENDWENQAGPPHWESSINCEEFMLPNALIQQEIHSVEDVLLHVMPLGRPA